MRSNAKWISVVALIWVILGGCVTIGNQLSDGVSAGDLSKIMAAVDKDKLIIHRKNPQGYTLLHEAIVNNQLNIAKFLIDRGLT